MIRTSFEIDGTFTNSADGQSLMENIASETGAELLSIGNSYLGKDLYCMKFGSGNESVVLTGGVHRSERASREMMLITVRDMAYNLQGKYDNIFNHFTIYAIPTVSPDTNTRLNAQGLNINRDVYQLDTPEMPALMSLISDVDPLMLIDFHERGGSGRERVEFVNPWKMDNNTHSEIYELNENLENHVKGKLENSGIETAEYPRSAIGPSMSTAIATHLGILSFTPETYTDVSGEFRINALTDTLDYSLEWLVLNKTQVRDFKNEHFNVPIKEGEKLYLINGDNEFYLSATNRRISTPRYYILESTVDFEKWQSVYNIEVDENGYIKTEQKTGLILPHLLDPMSDMKVAVATRQEPPQPDRRKDGRYTKVYMDGWTEVFIKNYF